MYENIEEESFKLFSKFRKITPIFLMRKFKITYDFAEIICIKIALRQHFEIRKFVKEMEM